MSQHKVQTQQAGSVYATQKILETFNLINSVRKKINDLGILFKSTDTRQVGLVAVNENLTAAIIIFQSLTLLGNSYSPGQLNSLWGSSLSFEKKHFNFK